ncbi:Nucleic acid-binding, OB-fold [Phytophthora cinnamomi]|uniref:Nucleic acid-binding, OB-fold n=1 Tax=Phytophthora cinnamomi TaxID=4785 RepID=UPI003559FDBF|nr:Nucleic acid-binding, OB-fold [Phytophthora cinnamomi]
MRELGKDPLTWSFVKLFGLQVARDLREFRGLPASHAWRWKTAGLWRARLLTKAQCSGVVVSVVERADRVELLVDDGTALVKAVLWGEGVQPPAALGDLVHVEGKLNVDRNWDAVDASRELRVLRVSKVEDPNEELLHWAQVVELSQSYYSSGGDALEAAPKPSDHGTGGEAQWEDIAAEAFFSLSVAPSSRDQFLGRSDRHPHDDILLRTLESLLERQKASGANEVADITFGVQLAAAERDAGTSDHDAPNTKSQRVRALQYAFRKLRRAGLLFLEDEDEDRHILLSFEAVLKPALLQILQGYSLGRSVAEVADAVLVQERFKCISLQWIETGLEHLLASRLIVQREVSQLFFIK